MSKALWSVLKTHPELETIMIAETISLDILSLPSVLAAVGMIPGIITIAGLGIPATYTGYVYVYPSH